MKIFNSAGVAATLALMMAFGGNAASGDDAAFAAAHREAANRLRTYVYNNDGCDMLYYQTNSRINVDAFIGQRLGFARDTRISTVSYCPCSSGFGQFCLQGVGDALTASDTSGSEYSRTHYNATLAFAAIGHDALEMALNFCRERGFERFMSIRMNDSHDGASRPHEGNYDLLFSPFRRRHPECLMGDPAKDEWPRQCAWQWTCVDYGQKVVRDYVRTFVRQFCEKYDMDGIELDFCRHPKYFRRCSYDEVATDAERALMTELVTDLRRIVQEHARKRGHPILLNARVPDSFEYCYDLGLDLESWLKAGALDGVIGGCYFNLNDWQVTCDRVHALGAKFYASIDESRIPGACRRWQRPCIPGRDSVENYMASYAQAMKAGCDGIYLFNLELERLVARTQVDPRDTDGRNKIYFATQRGKGGYEPIHYLKDGYRYMNLAYIDPAADPKTVLEDQRGMHDPGLDIAIQYVVDGKRSFALRLADDFERAAAMGKRPQITVMALTEGVTAPTAVGFSLNGSRLESGTFADGLYTFREVPPELIVCGINTVEVDPGGAGRFVLADFAVSIAYQDARKEGGR